MYTNVPLPILIKTQHLVPELVAREAEHLHHWSLPRLRDAAIRAAQPLRAADRASPLVINIIEEE